MEEIKPGFPHFEQQSELEIMRSGKLACSLYMSSSDNTFNRKFFWLDSIADLKDYLEGKYDNYKLAFGKASEDPVGGIVMICMQGTSALRSDVFLPGILYNFKAAKDKEEFSHLFKSLDVAMAGR